jgi:hypothetical protein
MPPRTTGAPRGRRPSRKNADSAASKEQRNDIFRLKHQLAGQVKSVALEIAVTNEETEQKRSDEEINLARFYRTVKSGIHETQAIASRMNRIVKKVEKSQKTHIKVLRVKTLLEDMEKYVRSLQNDVNQIMKLKEEHNSMLVGLMNSKKELMNTVFKIEDGVRNQLNVLLRHNTDNHLASQPWIAPGFGGAYNLEGTTDPQIRSEPLMAGVADQMLPGETEEQYSKRIALQLAEIRKQERQKRLNPSRGFTKDGRSKVIHHLLLQRDLQNEHHRVIDVPMEEFAVPQN